jgi:hypothetical protein
MGNMMMMMMEILQVTKTAELNKSLHSEFSLPCALQQQSSNSGCGTAPLNSG